jgi:hypothetical protein
MHNDNHTKGEEQVSQDTLEAIFKLAHSGSSPEAICFFLGLNAQTVHRIIANDTMHRARVVESIKEKSRKFRCVQSNRLMISPVMARDGNFYEHSILEADSSLSIDQFIPKLKAKIADFCKESLKELEGYLRQKDLQEDILELTAECLSVLCPEDGLESALRVLGLVERETVRRLTGKLWSLVPEDMLFGLINQLASEFPYHALCLAALIILKTRSERAFEEAFRSFTEILSQAALGPEAIDLAEEVSKRLSSIQLNQMNAALRAFPRQGGDRLDGLRLKEAYALLKEGKTEAANCIANTLGLSLEKEVQRFYDEAGLSSGKVPILEQRLNAKLKDISRVSPSLGETLSILHQLTNEALSEALVKLGQQTSNALTAQDARIQQLAEQGQKKEAECQETLSSLRVMVQALTEDRIKAGRVASQTQIVQETTPRSIERRPQQLETVDQKAFNSLRDKVEAWTGHLKAGEEMIRAQVVQIQGLDEKFNKAETATQQTLNTLRGVVDTLRTDLDQAWSQCQQAQLAQEAMLQMLEAQSERTLATVLNRQLAEISLQNSREALYHTTFIYSYKIDTDQLHRTNLVTGEPSSHRVLSYTFKRYCCWSEVPGGSLLITGGGHPTPVKEVVRIDLGTFEVSPQPHMLTPRYMHAAVYHTPHLYILAGWNDRRCLKECERYVCAENRWEALPPLPRACRESTGVVVESSLYALGGYDGGNLDLVQKLSLQSLTWELMQLRLPYASRSIACFKLRDTEVYLVVNKTLCSFTAFEVRPLKTLTKDIQSWFGASYYRRGTLYCSSFHGGVRSLEIGA